MKRFVSAKKIALLALVSLSTAGFSMSPAAAAYQHRIYPGSDSEAAKQARASRAAPDLYCEKHENECE